MTRHDARTAECFVYTFKEGVLSVVAHDLLLRVTDFSIEVDESAPSVSARFDPRSLRVEGVMERGHLLPGALIGSDRRTIEENIENEVLQAERFPEIRFTSTSVKKDARGWHVEGRLALHGHEREITFQVAEKDGRRVAEVKLHQPAYGIKPYTAMLGTLRVSPDVKVTVSLPA
jgi:hypothetical protein